MKVIVSENAAQMGVAAAKHAAGIINEAIDRQGSARIVLSTGASQLEFIERFIKENIDWSKVEMFHLDEYVGLPESHPASFRKYLKERFAAHVQLGAAYYVDGEGNIVQHIEELSAQLQAKPVDLALIGIGENAHIAFNDPPADFDTEAAYIVVDLDDACKNQQVGEGWFATIDDVPKQAITMSVKQIMKSKEIISFVPYKVKAKAVQQTIEQELTNAVPSTMLKTHSNWTLYLDQDSASLIDVN